MVGRTLGHYEIIEPLGANGMGEVDLAEAARLGPKVALKLIVNVTTVSREAPSLNAISWRELQPGVQLAKSGHHPEAE